MMTRSVPRGISGGFSATAWLLLGLLATVGLTACDAGGAAPSAATAGDCGGACDRNALSAVDVERILAQTVVAAQSRGHKATVAVTDRVGNVLGVYAMDGAAPQFRIDGGRAVVGGLEGIDILPSTFAAISKAITGAYLSSAGNAFSTRTASHIVQENFNPLERNQPSGPLFGVQFSQLPCSDIVLRQSDAQRGPKRSPLGLAADPGGLPLYRDGQVVGGIGVISDSVYGLDLDISNVDNDADEGLAIAGSAGFWAPEGVRANRITADGRSLRYTDATDASATAGTSNVNTLVGLPGSLMAVPQYFSGAIRAGTAYGVAASGIRADAGVFADLGGHILVDAANANRYPAIAGSDAILAAAEVQQILRSALGVANAARAQIRAPAGQAAQVTVSVVDTQGEVLGVVRSPDAPIFGIDVALQKARSAAFMSNPEAAAELQNLPPANYLKPVATSAIAPYVSDLRRLLSSPTALADGTAYSTRTLGNLARPFLPDGVLSATPGPLSKSYPQWSPFSTGLQLDLSLNAIVAAAGGSLASGCTGLPRLKNGLQIFPGGIPIYRTTAGVTRLAGAIGVSGDGVDQDDMIAFLGLSRAASILDSGVGQAPTALRADRIVLPGGNLRYAQCPQAPFNASSEQNVCAGL
ncbi:MAG: hypothetical protein CFE43_10580 [Burkholderiales bacterium PBB3]|nr:MAG: hypothetical protein CFE43_10580 [Burkholderiales bacterium PBB3]